MYESPTTLEIEALIEQAKMASQRAYAPYSRFHVGSAVLTASGKIISGCNVENASYGLTICAERNCLAAAINQDEKKFKALAVYVAQLTLTPPCGACRQVIVEFFPQQATVILANHKNKKELWKVAELLPAAFGPDNL